MPLKVGNDVKFIGTLDDVHWLGLDDVAPVLWSESGKVINVDNDMGYCLVEYNPEYWKFNKILPMRMLEKK
jgi:hypothetical protein